MYYWTLMWIYQLEGKTNISAFGFSTGNMTKTQAYSFKHCTSWKNIHPTSEYQFWERLTLIYQVHFNLKMLRGCHLFRSPPSQQITLPEVFDEARQKLSVHIHAWGYQDSKVDYYSILQEADVVVSTAKHEFYGVAMWVSENVICVYNIQIPGANN